METVKEIHLLGIETKRIYERICKMEPGDILKYEELGTLIDQDIQGTAGRSYLASARKKAQNENQIVLMTLRKVGIKRVSTPDEYFKLSEDSITRIRKSARKAHKRQSCIDYDSLTQEEKNKHNLLQTYTYFINNSGKKPQLDKLENAVKVKSEQLVLSETIKAFL